MRNKIRIIIIFVVMSMLMTTTLLASDLNIHGELRQVLNYDLDINELIQADSEYKLIFKKGLGFDGDLYLSLKGKYDNLKNKGEFDLDEAFTTLYFPSIDLTIGKQVINWGTADGINPTNNINPVDISSFTEGKLTREPVLSAQASYFGENVDITGVVVFDFIPQDLRSMSSYFGEKDTLLTNIDAQLPDNSLKNMEYAFKMEKRIAGYDLKLSYFHGWDDLPGIIKSNLEADYQQIDKFGMAAAGEVNTVGVWGEISYNKPEEKELTAQTIFTTMNQSYYQAVIGSDYTFTNGIYLEGQYIYYGNGSIFNPYHEATIRDEDVKAAQYLMGHISYDFEKDKIELTSLFNITDNSALVMPVYIRSLNPVTDLKISPIIPLGEEDGELQMINRQLKVSIDTSF